MRIKKMKITVKVGSIELTYQEDNYKTEKDFDIRMIKTLCEKAQELLKKQQEVILNMQWTELCEKAKEMGYVKVEKFPYGKPEMALVNEDVEIAFYKNGIVECKAYNDEYCGRPFTRDRTPEQMLAIMEALR